jgi:prolyl-tRNA synthetase
MLGVYAHIAEKFLALPVLKGVKTPNERFAGALETYCIEALMQDGKALQAGTSHFLGQNFAKAFDVKFSSKEGKLDHVWATSWGVSTRLMGALVMAHSDDEGLVLPPMLAPIQAVIIPIYKTAEELQKVSEKALQIKKDLEAKGISVKFDNSDNRSPGWKFAEYEFKGVPVRIAIGPRDLQNESVELARRDLKTKEVVKQADLTAKVVGLMKEIQDNLFNKALSFRKENTHVVDSYDDFKKALEKGGFVYAHWDGTAATEEKIKENTKATIRCIPIEGKAESGKCVLTGKPSEKRVVFALAY